MARDIKYNTPGEDPQPYAYQPAERRLRITRGCLEVFAEFRNPVAIVTKSALVARDVDLLSELRESGSLCASETP